ncbi:MAG: hypothetical protein LBV29_03370 [Azoarcus sp.]|nr:hypothetical protein [Azoarcus sp.]
MGTSRFAPLPALRFLCFFQFQLLCRDAYYLTILYDNKGGVGLDSRLPGYFRRPL